MGADLSADLGADLNATHKRRLNFVGVKLSAIHVLKLSAELSASHFMVSTIIFEVA